MFKKVRSKAAISTST